MQLQHRNHLKDQLQSRKSASALTLSQVFLLLLTYLIMLYIWFELSLLSQKKQLLKLSVVCSCSTYVQKYLVFLILPPKYELDYIM
jgi:hypothetical protein